MVVKKKYFTIFLITAIRYPFNLFPLNFDLQSSGPCFHLNLLTFIDVIMYLIHHL